MLTIHDKSVYNSKAVSDTATVERDLSSAGRASALQAEGHRFEPYRPHIFFYITCRSGGTGRRPGLKIPWVVIPVPVRFRSAALMKSGRNVEFTAFLLFFSLFYFEHP